VRSVINWSYDYPTWVLGLAFFAVFLGSSSAGIFVARRTVHSWFHRPGRSRENEMVGIALANCFLVVGLLLGLVAVATYQNYTAVGDTVDKEASTLAVFAADSAAYPPPYRLMLLVGLNTYVKTTLEQDWPELRHGNVPMAGTKALLAVGKVLLTFEPATENQKILQARSFQSLNNIIELRRNRISLTQLGLPPVLWWVVGFGLFVNLCLIWVQDMEIHVHYVLGAALSLSLGSVVFLTAVLENPFRGQTGVGPESIQNVAHLMETMAPGMDKSTSPVSMRGM
jgi:MFS family permease